MPATIRPCTPNDLPQVEPLYLDLYNRKWPAAEDQPLSERLGPFFLVAELAGQVVGFAIGAQGAPDAVSTAIADSAFSDHKTYLELQDLYVVPAHRNQGIGSLLVKHVLQAGRDHGLHHAMVYTSNPDYPRTGRFYERCGFRINHLFMTI